MQFVKLEERVKRGSVEYYVRVDQIREITVEKDDSGGVAALSVFQMSEDPESAEDIEFAFEGEDAERNYSNVQQLLAASGR
jgi:hypothetical protein